MRCCSRWSARNSCASSTRRRKSRASPGMLPITPQGKPWHSASLRSLLYPSRPNMPTLICDCNKTMPLQEKTLGAALGENLTLHSGLCRREAGEFQRAIRGVGDVVVACTQEKRLFAEIAENTEGAVAPTK